jgi:hypothetical protein
MDMGHNEEIKRLKKLNKILKEMQSEVFNEIQHVLNPKQTAQIKFTIQHGDDGTLSILSAMALANENYRICEAIKQILEERRSNLPFVPTPV